MRVVSVDLSLGAKVEDERFAKRQAANEKGCALNNAKSCYRAAYARLTGYGVEQDVKGAKALFEKACEDDNADACTSLAHGYELEQKVESARLMYTKACDLNSRQACSDLAFFYEELNEMHKALKYRKRACDEGEGWNCSKAGEAYQKGILVEKDEDLALLYFQSGCEEGSATACEQARKALSDEH